MATKQPGNELVPLADYAIARVEPADLAEILAENVGRTLTEFDLTRAKVPTGGATVWSVPTIDGTDEHATTLDGVIVYHRDPRAYWSVPFAESGGGTPPDCASAFGDHGVGTPGVECDTCAFAQWGSKVSERGEETRGQACKQMKLVFLLRPDSLLPLALFLPPTSIAPARKYLLGLASQAQHYASVVTSIGLEKDRSGDGIEYAKATFRRAGVLDAEEAERVRAYADSIRSALDVVTIQPSDVEDVGPDDES